jgi:hypothetical protein
VYFVRSLTTVGDGWLVLLSEVREGRWELTGAEQGRFFGCGGDA